MADTKYYGIDSNWFDYLLVVRNVYCLYMAAYSSNIAPLAALGTSLQDTHRANVRLFQLNKLFLLIMRLIAYHTLIKRMTQELVSANSCFT